MFRILMLAVSLFACFVPAHAEGTGGAGTAQYGQPGFGGQGQGYGGQQPGYDGQEQGQQAPEQAAPAGGPAERVQDILSFRKEVGLTSQQFETMRIIAGEARTEAAKRNKAVQDYRQKLSKSMNYSTPDFNEMRTLLSKLTEAQAAAEAVSIDAYEKAYNLLTDDQKAKLSFFRAQRTQAAEKKAKEAEKERQYKERQQQQQQQQQQQSFPSAPGGPTPFGR